MSNTFASLRKKSNGIEDIRNKFKKLKDGGGGNRNVTLEDETFWDTKHIRGPKGVGVAVVRFLPAGPTESDPILKIEEYNWKGPGGYYINLSRRTLGADQADPAYEYNGTVFGDKSLTKEEKFKKLVNRKESYIARIKVLKDPNKPENEGKTFKWKFGPQIYNIIDKALFPEFETDEPINVFDPIEGADFELKVITKQIPDSKTGNMVDVPSYENSRFKDPSVFMDEEEFEEFWQTLPTLNDIISEDKFKSYDQLKKELDRALGRTNNNSDDGEDKVEVKEKASTSKPKETKSKSEKKVDEKPIDDDIPFEFPDEPTNETVTETESTSEVDTGDVDDWLNSITTK